LRKKVSAAARRESRGYACGHHATSTILPRSKYEHTVTENENHFTRISGQIKQIQEN